MGAMSSLALLILIIAVVALLLIGVVVGFVVRGRKPAPLPDTHTDVLVQPPVTDAPPVELSSPPATIERPEAAAEGTFVHVYVDNTDPARPVTPIPEEIRAAVASLVRG